MDAVLQDLRYAARSLRRQPAFALLAIGTLALGIGANAAIFSVVNAVLLRPLGYYRPDRIVALTTQWQKTGRRGTVSAPDFHDWHDATSSFAAMAYYTYDLDFETSVNVDGVADYGSVVLVTPEFFDVFGVDALVGRAHRAHRVARRRAGGGDQPRVLAAGDSAARPGAIGRTVTFGQRAVTIVGVMPPGFGFPGRTDIWYFPSSAGETASRSAHNYRVVARLKDGVAVDPGTGGTVVAGRAAVGGVSGLERRQGRGGRTAAGTAGRRHPADAVSPVRRGRPRAADRLRERRESPARARHGPDERTRRSRRARRRTRAGSWRS